MIKKTIHISSPSHLSLRQRQMVIKPKGEIGAAADEISRPIEDIGVLIIESSQVTLTSALISFLLSNNVALITCNKSHMPDGLMLKLSGNTLQRERFGNQITASLPLKKRLWQQTVRAKIINQAACLSMMSGAETGCMIKWADQVKSGDPENVEGRAAAYYWRNLFYEIQSFKREREGEPPNNLLNYGYIVLRAIIARSLVGSGLLPTLGIHHCNRYNAYCLADDVMEPYRPYVDRLVVDIMRRYGTDTELTTDVKRELLSIPVIDVTIENRRSPLLVASSTTSASLVRCYMGLQRKISYPDLSIN